MANDQADGYSFIPDDAEEQERFNDALRETLRIARHLDISLDREIAASSRIPDPAERVSFDIRVGADLTCSLLLKILIEERVQTVDRPYGCSISRTVDSVCISDALVERILSMLPEDDRIALAQRLSADMNRNFIPHLELQGKFEDIPVLREQIDLIRQRIMNAVYPSQRL